MHCHEHTLEEAQQQKKKSTFHASTACFLVLYFSAHAEKLRVFPFFLFALLRNVGLWMLWGHIITLLYSAFIFFFFNTHMSNNDDDKYPPTLFFFLNNNSSKCNCIMDFFSHVLSSCSFSLVSICLRFLHDVPRRTDTVSVLTRVFPLFALFALFTSLYHYYMCSFWVVSAFFSFRQKKKKKIVFRKGKIECKESLIQYARKWRLLNWYHDFWSGQQ